MAPGQGRIRMHVAESVPSLTGTVTSMRLPCDPSRIALLAQTIGAALGVAEAANTELSDAERRWSDRAIKELTSHHGRSLLAAGPHLEPRWQVLAALVNERLGNVGQT